MDGAHWNSQLRTGAPWIIQESTLLTAITSGGEINQASIDREIRAVIMHSNQGVYPFSNLYSKCATLQAKHALGLCNHYFSILTKHPDIALSIHPNDISELIGTFGINALLQSNTLVEFEEVLIQLHHLLDWIPGTAQAMEKVLSRFPQTPHSELIRMVAQNASGAALFQKSVVCYSSQHDRMTPVDSLSKAASYIQICAFRLPNPESPSCLNDKIAILVAEFGMRGIDRCHCLIDFTRLISEINSLFNTYDGSRSRTEEYLRSLSETSQRNLLLKIVHGITGADLVTAIVMNTSDEVFNTVEWNVVGTHCLRFRYASAQLWLAIGANATAPNLIQHAAQQVGCALRDENFWYYRGVGLLKRLISNIEHYSPLASRALESRAKSAKWISLPISLWLLEMDNPNRLPLVEQALILRNADTLTERQAIQLWQLGLDCDQWETERRGEWLTLHSQIASRLAGSQYALSVQIKLEENQQLL